ncbi:lectin-like isoform X2 [Carassius carassius]|uniref:lectin-like isoform X2 n=1 Tax=Carassius carassius TaxID=217509 RepID=UPI002868ED72|nr:lectin-like isoform X2 [Carassius carassius]
MVKSGSIGVLLMALLFGSGDFLKMERGRTNVTEQCSMLQPCNVYGFTDWYKLGSVCVKYFNNSLNFTEAEFSCRTQAPGAHLVSVHKQKHNAELHCIVTTLNPKHPRIWLGAFELFKSGKFLWLDGSYWDYDNWNIGQPSNLYTNTEECVEMNWNETGKWNDRGCHNKENYICAFKLNGILKPGSEEME